MPSAGKSVVELVTCDDRHVAWVEVRVAETAAMRASVKAPVVLTWGARVFVWTTLNAGGFFVFKEASLLYSHTPSPGLDPAELGAMAGQTVVFGPAAQERLAEQVAAVDFAGELPSKEQLASLRDRIANTPGKEGKKPWKP